MKLKIYTVDAFTKKPFCGNPAAVVPLLQRIPEDTMQNIAKEMNLSETAYVSPQSIEEGMNEEEHWRQKSKFSLRWFTPTNEVPLCGHATLATAHILFNHYGNVNNEIEFETKSGTLTATKEDSNIVMHFPSNKPEDLHPTLSADLGGIVKEVVNNKLPVREVKISHKTKKLLVCLNFSCTREDLESLRPDMKTLMSLHDGSVVKGIIVTTSGDIPIGDESDIVEGETSKGYHFLSRYFAPWNGIPEDPVTGSAHTVLAPYWSDVLSRKKFRCRQCSPRGGDLLVSCVDGKVDLSGCATTVLQGNIEF